MLLGDFGAALEKFRMVFSVVEEIEQRRNRSHLSGDIMYCEFRMGRREQAVKLAIELLHQDHSILDVDDRVVMARQLVEVFGAIGDRDLEREAVMVLSAAVDVYEAAIARIRAEFAEFYVSTRA